MEVARRLERHVSIFVQKPNSLKVQSRNCNREINRLHVIVIEEEIRVRTHFVLRKIAPYKKNVAMEASQKATWVFACTTAKAHREIVCMSARDRGRNPRRSVHPSVHPSVKKRFMYGHGRQAQRQRVGGWMGARSACFALAYLNTAVSANSMLVAPYARMAPPPLFSSIQSEKLLSL